LTRKETGTYFPCFPAVVTNSNSLLPLQDKVVDRKAKLKCDVYVIVLEGKRPYRRLTPKNPQK
jgi:hypothetical protein